MAFCRGGFTRFSKHELQSGRRCIAVRDCKFPHRNQHPLILHQNATYPGLLLVGQAAAVAPQRLFPARVHLLVLLRSEICVGLRVVLDAICCHVGVGSNTDKSSGESFFPEAPSRKLPTGLG